MTQNACFSHNMLILSQAGKTSKRIWRKWRSSAWGTLNGICSCRLVLWTLLCPVFHPLWNPSVLEGRDGRDHLHAFPSSVSFSSLSCWRGQRWGWRWPWSLEVSCSRLFLSYGMKKNTEEIFQFVKWQTQCWWQKGLCNKSWASTEEAGAQNAEHNWWHLRRTKKITEHCWCNVLNLCESETHVWIELTLMSPSLSQVPVGAGFPRDADWSGADHGWLHRCDVRGKWRRRPRQRSSGRPQEALQEAQRFRERLPQQVNTLMGLIYGSVCLISLRRMEPPSRRYVSWCLDTKESGKIFNSEILPFPWW